MKIIIISFLSFFTSLKFIQWLISYSQKKSIYQSPNERSAHSHPTPNIAGIGFSTCIAIFWASFLALEWIPNTSLTRTIPILAFLLSIIGILDDVKNLSRRLRLAIQTLSALYVLYLSSPSLTIFHLANINTLTSMLILLGSFIWIAGFINAYNFMDGIDGIAGSQALIYGIGWLSIGIRCDITFAALIGALIASTMFAFLIFNWHPAKIFMGDSGSTFLGFLFATIPFVAASTLAPTSSKQMLLSGIVLTWPFIFDPAFTIIKRLKNRKCIFTPHREFLFHRLAISGKTHTQVTFLYSLLSLSGIVISHTVLNLSFFGGILFSVSSIAIIAFFLCALTNHTEQKASFKNYENPEKNKRQTAPLS